MSNANSVAKAVEELRNIASSINTLADRLADLPGNAEPEEKTLSLEEVRAVLAEKSRMGFTSAVRNLLDEFGADRLSAVDPKHYAQLIARAEEW